MSYNLEQQSGINGCFDNPALAIATTTSAFKTANAISYAIAGQIYSKAATDNQTQGKKRVKVATHSGKRCGGSKVCTAAGRSAI